jgi:hypothetical protein
MSARITILAAAMTTSLACGASAQVLVVSASGPSADRYPAGTVLAPSADLNLRAGDHLTLLDRSGTRQIMGPGHIDLSKSSSAARPDGAMAAQGGRRAVIGAARGFRPAPVFGPKNIWRIDPNAGGDFCVAEGERPSLTRFDLSSPITIAITRTRDNQSLSVNWPAWSTLDWPVALPLADGERYAIATNGHPPVQVTWHVLSGRIGSLGELAARLEKNACGQQLAGLQADQ